MYSCCEFWWLVCFFKQKTAYEMRISDWSSDVCSSDLLDLDPDTGARVYGVEVWEEGDRAVPGTGSRWFLAEPRVTPTIRGRALDYIPFWFVGSTSLSPDVEKPPILDLVNANWHHSLLSADHDHGLHWVSLPTPRSEEHPSELQSLMSTTY